MFYVQATCEVISKPNDHQIYLRHKIPISYIVEALERRLGRYWRDQDIVYNYEAALRSGHSDWDGNDISPDSPGNDLGYPRLIPFAQ